MLYLGLVGLLAFVASFFMDAFLTISSTRQTTRIRGLTFKCNYNKIFPNYYSVFIKKKYLYLYFF